MLQIHVDLCKAVQLLTGFLLCNGRKLEEAKNLKCFKCVGQLYEDKSLTLCARDLIFTTDLQTVSSLLELICFFINLKFWSEAQEQMTINNFSIFSYGGQCVWQARLFEQFL